MRTLLVAKAAVEEVAGVEAVVVARYLRRRHDEHVVAARNEVEAGKTATLGLEVRERLLHLTHRGGRRRRRLDRHRGWRALAVGAHVCHVSSSVSLSRHKCVERRDAERPAEARPFFGLN